MTTESRPGIGFTEASSEEQIEAVRRQMLIEHEGVIAGHEEYSGLNDKKSLAFSGLLRGIFLERVTRGYLYNENSQGSQKRDDTVAPQSDELFSLGDYLHSVSLARGAHNTKYAKDNTEAIIPPTDPEQAQDFMLDQFKGGLVQLVKKDGHMLMVKNKQILLVRDDQIEIVIDGVDQADNDKVLQIVGRFLEKEFDNPEIKNEKIFRFPPTQFERRREEVREEKERIKKLSVQRLFLEKSEEFERTGNPVHSLFNVTELVRVYNGELEESDFKDEVTMYFGEQSARAYLSELMWEGELEEALVSRQVELDGETYVIDEERYYRQKPQEAPIS